MMMIQTIKTGINKKGNTKDQIKPPNIVPPKNRCTYKNKPQRTTIKQMIQTWYKHTLYSVSTRWCFNPIVLSPPIYNR